MTSLFMVTSIHSIQKSRKNSQKFGQELERLEDVLKFKNQKREIKKKVSRKRKGLKKS